MDYWLLFFLIFRGDYSLLKERFHCEVALFLCPLMKGHFYKGHSKGVIDIGKNIGKVFERNWKNSIPDNIFYYRPPDSAQSFGTNQNLRFSAKSPCDCFMFTGNFLYALELKSVGSKSISFEKEKTDKGIIHKHQIDNLYKFSSYNNIISGFIFDFRLSNSTYFCSINDFIHMIGNLNKKSFNENDMIKLCNPIEIKKSKLKVNYRYDINDFIMNTGG